MSLEYILKHAQYLFQEAVSAEGEQRQKKLREAENFLANLPDDYPGKKELLEKINYMLH